MTEAKTNEAQEKLRQLKEPFPESDIKWRVQSTGEKNGKKWVRVLAYIDNRAIQERLDSVFGVECWQNKFTPLNDGDYLCGISAKFGDEWITKWDGADKTAIEETKGGISSAMKRAGSQWGIGRYLYKLESGYGVISDNGKFSSKDKKDVWFKWNPPKLPSWALPKGSKTSQDGSGGTTEKKTDQDKGQKEKPVTENPEPFNQVFYNSVFKDIKGCLTEESLTSHYNKNKAFIDDLPEQERKDMLAEFTRRKGELNE